MRIGIVGFIYLVIGLIIASQRNYLGGLGLDHLAQVFRAILAIFLWPLVFLHLVNLHHLHLH